MSEDLTHRVLRVRLYPNVEQEKLLRQNVGSVRFVYNYFLGKRQEFYERTKKSKSYFDCTKILTKLKKKKNYEWLQDVDSTSLQQALKDQQTAYTNFFKHGSRFPKFKAKRHGGSFRVVMGLSIDCFERKLKIGKHGWIKFRSSDRDYEALELVDKLQSITVVQNSDGTWEASVLYKTEAPDPLPAVERTCGIDLGLETWYTIVGPKREKKVVGPRPFRENQESLAFRQQQLSKKLKGSKNYEKLRKKIARLHKRVANVRKDFQHKTAKQIVQQYGTIVVESLSIKGLMKTKLAKSFGDAGHSTFLSILKMKAANAGRTIVEVPRNFASSQFCSDCGHRDGLKPLTIREWCCPSCGTIHDRDINAARNLRLFSRLGAACNNSYAESFG